MTNKTEKTNFKRNLVVMKERILAKPPGKSRGFAKDLVLNKFIHRNTYTTHRDVFVDVIDPLHSRACTQSMYQ